MKILVIFYSLTGNCRMIAEMIKKTVQADLLELKPEQNIPQKGFMKYFQGGKAVIKKQKPKLAPADKNLDDYDLIFIGTPVWAWSYAPALNSLFSDYVIKSKQIALFCCHGGGKGKTLEKMETVLAHNNILGKIDFFEPLKYDPETNREKAAQWAESMVSKAEP